MSMNGCNGKIWKRAWQKAMQTGRDYSRNLNHNVILAVQGVAPYRVEFNFGVGDCNLMGFAIGSEEASASVTGSTGQYTAPHARQTQPLTVVNSDCNTCCAWFSSS